MAILIFENNALLAKDIERNLIDEGYNVLLIREPSEVPEEDEFWQGIDLIILDLMMGDIELPKEWREESENGLITGYIVYKHLCSNKNIPVLVLTGLKDEKLVERVKSGIVNCIVSRKPIVYVEFLNKVKQLLNK